MRQPAETRLAWLAARASTEPDAVARIEELLLASQDDDGFLSPGGALTGAIFGELCREIVSGDEAAPALQPGTAIGRYVVDERIGVGGMGEVYRARDSVLGRRVALKVLPAGVVGDDRRVARLRREARVLAALNHPNVAPSTTSKNTPTRPCSCSSSSRGPRSGPPCGRHAAGRRGARHRATGRRRARGSSPARHRPPRPQAGQHQDRSGRAGEGARLRDRDRAARRGGRLARGLAARERHRHDCRRRAWDNRLHVPRAAARRGGGSPGRHLGLRVRAVRVARGRHALRPPIAGRDAGRHPGPRACDGQLPASTPRAMRELVAACLEKDVARRLGRIGDARALLDARTVHDAGAPLAGRTFIGRARRAGPVVLGSDRRRRSRVPAVDGPPAPPSSVARLTVPVPVTDTLVTGALPSVALSPDGSTVVYRARAAATGSSCSFVRWMRPSRWPSPARRTRPPRSSRLMADGWASMVKA